MAEVRRREYFYESFERFCEFQKFEDWTDFTIEIANSRLEQLESKWQKLETAHLSLVEANSVTAPEQSLTFLDNAERIYRNCKATIRQRLADLNTKKSYEECDIDDDDIDTNLLTEIGCFDGVFAKWNDFRDRFIAKVHANETLRKSQKLNLLKAAVTDRAKRVLGKWRSIDENYALAWDKLCDVFNNQYQIVRAHMQSLQTLPQLNVPTFDLIYDVINRITFAKQQLIAMDIPADKWDLMLVYLTEERLNALSRGAWLAYRENKQIILPQWHDMQQFLQSLALALPENGLATAPAKPKATSKAPEPVAVLGSPPTPAASNGTVVSGTPKSILKRKSIVSPVDEPAAKKNGPKSEVANEKRISFGASPKATTTPSKISARRKTMSSLSTKNQTDGVVECVVCRSFKLARIVKCSDCPTTGHYTCLRKERMLLNKENESIWKCPKCLRCAVCNSTQKLVSRVLRRLTDLI